MVELVISKEACCGCTACMNICKQNAITMIADSEGFLYPQIEHYKCTECGLCKKVCNANDLESKQNNSPKIYAVKHKSNEVRMSSTSGGVFTAISDFILEKNGVVFGAAFDENMKVCHQKAETREEREKFKGSKYVQSNLGNTFRDIKDLLNNNRYVLFTGTPCQVDGLNRYLKNINIDKLLTCDVVCHGVPSPLIWEKHLEYINLDKNKRILDYKFRDKNIGWRGSNVSIYFDDGNKISNNTKHRVYSNLYFLSLITREACHNCRYTNLNRCSDITIGDFWGIERCMPEFDDNKGVSLVLFNTSKGKECFNNIVNDLEVKESNEKDCLQPQLQYPTKLPKNRNEFWNDYNNYGFEYISKKYGGSGLKNTIKRIIVNILKKMNFLDRAIKIKKILKSQ